MGHWIFAKKNRFSFYLFKDQYWSIVRQFNTVSSTVKSKYILYAHDDMYFCPNWDTSLLNEIKKFKHDKFFLSGTLIEAFTGHIIFNCRR